jgi:hypothetical protein
LTVKPPERPTHEDLDPFRAVVDFLVTMHRDRRGMGDPETVRYRILTWANRAFDANTKVPTELRRSGPDMTTEFAALPYTAVLMFRRASDEAGLDWRDPHRQESAFVRIERALVAVLGEPSKVGEDPMWEERERDERKNQWVMFVLQHKDFCDWLVTELEAAGQPPDAAAVLRWDKSFDPATGAITLKAIPWVGVLSRVRDVVPDLSLRLFGQMAAITGHQIPLLIWDAFADRSPPERPSSPAEFDSDLLEFDSDPLEYPSPSSEPECHVIPMWRIKCDGTWGCVEAYFIGVEDYDDIIQMDWEERQRQEEGNPPEEH